ncbi:MAG: GNAT family N-acetyltransferase [Acutalibacter sp.]|nr:GNAT family N-acetyltransferase [Acutalibacter sp.]
MGMRLFRWMRGELETPRLILRRWKRQDFDAYVSIVSDPQVMIPAGCRPAETLQAAAAAFSRDLHNEDCFAIAVKATGEVVGRIKYQSDLRRFQVNSLSVGYELRRDCWGRGYMPEALRAMVTHAFEQKKVDVMAISHYAGNFRSQRVIEKCGFKLEGVVPWACRRCDGQICDDVCYSILRADYFAERQ